MAAPSLRTGGDRALGRFEFYDVPDEAAAPRQRASGRLIPGSVRHSRHAVSLGRSDFCCWCSVVRKYLDDFNYRLVVCGGNRERRRICLLITPAPCIRGARLLRSTVPVPAFRSIAPEKSVLCGAT
jgi:hypothetical protein